MQQSNNRIRFQQLPYYLDFIPSQWDRIDRLVRSFHCYLGSLASLAAQGIGNFTCSHWKLSFSSSRSAIRI
jgi:hypothetical protein